ncbi:MAG: Plug domain-containing protein, partial [Pseudomonadota bacterium]
MLLASVTTAQQNTPSAGPLETVVVTAVRQAYRGDFTFMETPQADTIINAEILTQVGALDLDQALDLSASVARQNNFGGLWNSFAVRGFVGDENLPSNYLVNGFNAGRGFGGPRDLSGTTWWAVSWSHRLAIWSKGLS